MIELKQVTKQYGKATVLKNITLSVDEPGIYCLLGRNGAGKTTLLKSIAGYQNITDGMLTESFQKHPRIIIVSTHIIEEIAKTIQKLIIIDKGIIVGGRTSSYSIFRKQQRVL